MELLRKFYDAVSKLFIVQLKQYQMYLKFLIQSINLKINCDQFDFLMSAITSFLVELRIFNAAVIYCAKCFFYDHL